MTKRWRASAAVVMISTVLTATLVGIDPVPVTVEADIVPGIPRMFVVGLPDAAVSEAQERVRSAIKNTPGVDFPLQRITINLAPADVRKEGSGFDCAIALAILCSKQTVPAPGNACVLGELALDGALRPITGMLPIVAGMIERGTTHFFVPSENAAEAALADGAVVYPVRTLHELIHFLRKPHSITPFIRTPRRSTHQALVADFRDIAGQQHAKRCLEIAAAGGHNVLLSGPPGSGKTLLAKAVSGILPPLSGQEALDVTRIYSVAGLLDRSQPLVEARPFRSPHHSASPAAIVGGGTNPHPGEITLAHRGVLMLDEFPEFPRIVLESLRQPLEDGVVNVSRASLSVRFPCRFMLIASQNPCPCGYADDPERACQCSPRQREQYRRRVSGPLIDRIDLYCSVPRQPVRELEAVGTAESSSRVQERVAGAREKQHDRFQGSRLNSAMQVSDLKRWCVLDGDGTLLLRTASTSMQLSGRAYHRVLKVARTIADLEGSAAITTAHLAEALQFRRRTEQ